MNDFISKSGKPSLDAVDQSLGLSRPRLPARSMDISDRYTEEQLCHTFDIFGVKVTIYFGNLLKEETDAIVNSSNEQLEHYGGIAYAILKARGREMEEECRHYVRKNGKLKTTEVMVTSGGKDIKSTHIIHAAGPMWLSENYKDKFTCQLTQTFLNCFDYADKRLWIKSIALPVLSSGVYGAPLDTCVKCFLDAVLIFINGNRETLRLEDIRLVNSEAECTVTSIVLVSTLLDHGVDILTANAEHFMSRSANNAREMNIPRGWLKDSTDVTKTYTKVASLGFGSINPSSSSEKWATPTSRRRSSPLNRATDKGNVDIIKYDPQKGEFISVSYIKADKTTGTSSDVGIHGERSDSMNRRRKKNYGTMKYRAKLPTARDDKSDIKQKKEYTEKQIEEETAQILGTVREGGSGSKGMENPAKTTGDFTGGSGSKMTQYPAMTTVDSTGGNGLKDDRYRSTDLQVIVVAFDKKKIAVDVKPNETVAAVKEKLMDKKHADCDIDGFSLNLCGAKLDDKQTVESFNIQPNSEIIMMKIRRKAGKKEKMHPLSSTDEHGTGATYEHGTGADQAVQSFEEVQPRYNNNLEESTDHLQIETYKASNQTWSKCDTQFPAQNVPQRKSSNMSSKKKSYEVKKVGKFWLLGRSGGNLKVCPILTDAEEVDQSDNFIVADDNVYEIKEDEFQQLYLVDVDEIPIYYRHNSTSKSNRNPSKSRQGEAMSPSLKRYGKSVTKEEMLSQRFQSYQQETMPQYAKQLNEMTITDETEIEWHEDQYYSFEAGQTEDSSLIEVGFPAKH